MENNFKIICFSEIIKKIHINISNILFKIYGDTIISINKDINIIFMHYILQEIIHIIEINPSTIFICDDFGQNEYDFYYFIDKNTVNSMIKRIIKRIHKNLSLQLVYNENINKLSNDWIDFDKDIINKCKCMFRNNKINDKKYDFRKIKKLTLSNNLIQMNKYFNTTSSSKILQGEIMI
jgi:hypothetical protein